MSKSTFEKKLAKKVAIIEYLDSKISRDRDVNKHQQRMSISIGITGLSILIGLVMVNTWFILLLIPVVIGLYSTSKFFELLTKNLKSIESESISYGTWEKINTMKERGSSYIEIRNQVRSEGLFQKTDE